MTERTSEIKVDSDKVLPLLQQVGTHLRSLFKVETA